MTNSCQYRVDLRHDCTCNSVRELYGCRHVHVVASRGYLAQTGHCRGSGRNCGDHLRPLGRLAKRAALRAALDSLEATKGNPYVITGKPWGSHITDLQHPWRRIRDRAGLPGVRIHDLRHTYASNAVSGGMPIQMVGKLLGHSQLQTTMRD